MEAAKHAPSGQQVPVDVWATSFAQQAREWEVPLVDLEKLGIRHDDDGFLESSELVALTSGAEALPYLDTKGSVVYKLFDLKPTGSLGKKLVVSDRDGEGFEIDVRDAVLVDTLEKLVVLNDAGGHPTEIVGLAASGDYLVAKQPLAYDFEDFHADRDRAEVRLNGIPPVGGGLRQRVVVTHIHDKPWLVGDLHARNIMRDSDGVPTVIDALIGAIPPLVLKRHSWLRQASDDAREFRRTNRRPQRSAFDDVDDDVL